MACALPSSPLFYPVNSLSCSVLSRHLDCSLPALRASSSHLSFSVSLSYIIFCTSKPFPPPSPLVPLLLITPFPSIWHIRRDRLRTVTNFSTESPKPFPSRKKNCSSFHSASRSSLSAFSYLKGGYIIRMHAMATCMTNKQKN